MEQKREGRRPSIASFHGLLRRRPRIATSRNAPEGQMEETGRLRDRKRLHRNERDGDGNRELCIHNKQRRCEGRSSINSARSSESNDEVYEEEESSVSRSPILSPNTLLLSSSISIHSRRRTVSPTRMVGTSSPANEMLVFHIPRKARSVLTKMSHERWDSGTGVFREEQNRWRLSPLSVSRPMDGASPSSSIVSLNNKKLLGPKSGISIMPSKSSTLVPDEIEVAEALFDLKKQSHFHSQSHSSMKQSDCCNENLNSSGVIQVVDEKFTSIPAQASDLPEEMDSFSTDVGSKMKGAVSVQNSALAEIQAAVEKSKRMEAETMVDDSVDPRKGESSENDKDSMHPSMELVRGKRATGSEGLVSVEEEESLTCFKLDGVDPLDKTMMGVDPKAMATETKQKTKFEINVMEKAGLNKRVSPPNSAAMVADEDCVVIAKDDQEAAVKGRGEKKLGLIFLKEVPPISQQQGHRESNQYKTSIPCIPHNITQPSLFPFPVMAGWSGVFPLQGLPPALQTDTATDPCMKSSTPMQLCDMQPPALMLSQPQRKRCATHQYIARNIRHHQQLVKNSKWPTAASPAVYGVRSQNPSAMASAHIPGKPLLGGFCMGQNLKDIPVVGGKDPTSEITNIRDVAKNKRIILQQSPLQFSANHLLHQTVVGSPANHSGSLNSAIASRKDYSLCNTAGIGGTPANSLSLPAEAASVSFNCSNLPANEAPVHMSMIQNNRCPFPISKNAGTLSSYKEGSLTPIMPFPSRSYCSPIFQISQSHQLPLSQSTSSFSGSLSSSKQVLSQKQKCPHISSHSFLMSPTEYLRQQLHVPKSQTSNMPEPDVSIQNSALVTSNFVFHSEKPSSDKFSAPFQLVSFASMPQLVSFASMPPGIMSSGGKSQSKQQHGSKVGEELIPPAFVCSFGSTASTTADQSLSSIAQNPAIRQILPDLNQGGHQFSPSVQMPECNFQIPKVKGMAAPSNNRDSKTGAQSLFSAENSQQQLMAPQNQQVSQLQLTGKAQVNALTSKSSCSFITPIFQNNKPIFPHSSSLIKCTAQSFPRNNHPPTTVSQVPSTSATQSLKNLPLQQQLRNSQMESSRNGPSHKSSPACGRNVPSILDRCPTQLSEL